MTAARSMAKTAGVGALVAGLGGVVTGLVTGAGLQHAAIGVVGGATAGMAGAAMMSQQTTGQAQHRYNTLYQACMYDRHHAVASPSLQQR